MTFYSTINSLSPIITLLIVGLVASLPSRLIYKKFEGKDRTKAWILSIISFLFFGGVILCVIGYIILSNITFDRGGPY